MPDNNFRFLSARTGNGWLRLEDQKDDDGNVTVKGSLDLVKAWLTSCASTENLIVLTGLGTSLSIKTAADVTEAPTMADLWGMAEDEASENFAKVLATVKFDPDQDGMNLELLLSQCKLASAFLENDSDDANLVSAFESATENIIREECDFVSTELPLPHHEAFIQKIARRSTRLPRAKLFTTNYDLVFEEAARRRGFILIDGFSLAHPSTFDPIYYGYDIVRRDASDDAPNYIDNVIQFYKLHGSLNWEREGGHVVKKAAPKKPLLIYPRSSKYEHAFEPPYLDMMAAFQSALRQPNTAILVLGFGFNDSHLAEPIMASLRTNMSLKLCVVDPHYIPDSADPSVDEMAVVCDEYGNPYRNQIAKLVKSGDPRVGLVNAPFDQLVPFIPDLKSESEQEKHKARIDSLTWPV